MPEKVRIFERHRIAQEVKQHLRAVVQKGPIDMGKRNREHAGIFGISQETLKYLFRHGMIPGAPAALSRFDQGDLSFFPTIQVPDLIRRHLDPAGYLLAYNNPEEQKRRAIVYARFLAEEHGLLTELGYTVGNKKATNAVGYLVMDDITDFFTAHGKTEAEISAAVRKVEPRKGYLIAFSPEVERDQDYTFANGDQVEGDIRLKTGKKGLSYQYITAIEPLGEQEAVLLDQLLR